MTTSYHPMVDRAFIENASLIEPIPQPESAPFWSALREGSFMGGHDQAGQIVQLDEAVAPWNDPATVQWRPLSGRGSIYSWVRYHRGYMREFADLLPYAVATIELEEGPRLFARLVGFERDPLIGEAVSLIIERWPSGNCYPIFEPAATTTTESDARFATGVAPPAEPNENGDR